MKADIGVTAQSAADIRLGGCLLCQRGNEVSNWLQ